MFKETIILLIHKSWFIVDLDIFTSEFHYWFPVIQWIYPVNDVKNFVVRKLLYNRSSTKPNSAFRFLLACLSCSLNIKFKCKKLRCFKKRRKHPRYLKINNERFRHMFVIWTTNNEYFFHGGIYMRIRTYVL